MNVKFMNTINSKTFDPLTITLNLSDKINFQKTS